MDLDPCPTCGRPRAYTMSETGPGIVSILRGECGDWVRRAVIVALCAIAVLAIVATETVFH